MNESLKNVFNGMMRWLKNEESSRDRTITNNKKKKGGALFTDTTFSISSGIY